MPRRLEPLDRDGIRPLAAVTVNAPADSWRLETQVERDPVSPRRSRRARIEQGPRRGVRAILRAGEIPAPQPSAPSIVRGAPCDRQAHQVIARLPQTIVRIPREAAVIGIVSGQQETAVEDWDSIFGPEGRISNPNPQPRSPVGRSLFL